MHKKLSILIIAMFMLVLVPSVLAGIPEDLFNSAKFMIHPYDSSFESVSRLEGVANGTLFKNTGGHINDGPIFFQPAGSAAFINFTQEQIPDEMRIMNVTKSWTMTFWANITNTTQASRTLFSNGGLGVSATGIDTFRFEGGVSTPTQTFTYEFIFDMKVTDAEYLVCEAIQAGDPASENVEFYDEWYFQKIQFNATDQTLRYFINNTELIGDNSCSSQFDFLGGDSNQLVVGAHIASAGGLEEYFTDAVQSIYFFDRLITTEENDFLYNNGVGNLVLPSCGDIVTSDLTLLSDVHACDVIDGLIINASDVTLDCAGNSISSNTASTTGLNMLALSTEFHVENCNINGFALGINIPGSGTSDLFINDTNFNLNSDGVTVADFANELHFGDVSFNYLEGGSSAFTLAYNKFFSDDVTLECIGSNFCESGGFLFPFNDNAETVFNNLVIINEENAITLEDGGATGVSYVFNNPNIEVKPFALTGVPIGFLIEDFSGGATLTVNGGKITTNDSTLFSAVHVAFGLPGNVITFNNLTYSPDNETFDGDFGTVFRNWDSIVQTNQPNIDVILTSNQAVVTNFNTGPTGLVAFNLLEYEHDSATLTDSVPYDVQATQDSPPEAFVGGAFTVGSALANFFSIDGFTVGLIFQGIASIVAMAALFFVIFGFFMAMIKKGK